MFLGFLLNITDFLRQLLQRVFEARVLALQLCSGFWLALPICFHNPHRKGSDHTLLLLRVNLLLAGHDDLVELTAQCKGIATRGDIRRRLTLLSAVTGTNPRRRLHLRTKEFGHTQLTLID